MAETNTFIQSEEVQEFNERIKEDDLGPLWNAIPELVSQEPKRTAKPYLWKWKTVKAHLMEATKIFTPDRGGERRAIYFQNPGLKDRELGVGEPLPRTCMPRCSLFNLENRHHHIVTHKVHYGLSFLVKEHI